MAILTLTKYTKYTEILAGTKREQFIKKSIYQDDRTTLKIHVTNNNSSKIPEKKSNQTEISDR